MIQETTRISVFETIESIQRGLNDSVPFTEMIS